MHAPFRLLLTADEFGRHRAVSLVATELYGEIQIAVGVWEELGAGGRRWPGHDEVAHAAQIRQIAVHDQHLITVWLRDLHRGEAKILALALMDARDVRRVGQRLGLRTVGVLGVLLEAKQQGFAKGIRPSMDA